MTFSVVPSLEIFGYVSWSVMQDSNLRPSGPKPDALPDCANHRAANYKNEQCVCQTHVFLYLSLIFILTMQTASMADSSE